jgi:hypothetical protein
MTEHDPAATRTDPTELTEPTEPTEDVRLAVYTGFARTGHAPRTPELAASTGLTATQVQQELQRLHTTRDLVLEARDGDGDGARDSDRIVMAHPFSSIPLGFSVMGAQTLWWGGCAWDSFAVPHLLPGEPDVLVATRCPACDTAHAWVVDRDAPPQGEQVAHFLTPVHHIWDDVVHACGNQRLFCSTDCVGTWLKRTGQECGYVMDLATLWRLARGWYAGRMDRGYTRRDPSSAAAYFAEVGLRGPFWGLAAG